MANKPSHLPRRGQINVAELANNKRFGSRRTALTTKAKKFVVNLGTDEKPDLKAYTTVAGHGVAHLGGPSRIVAEALFDLYAKAPSSTVNAAIKWAMEMLPELVPDGDLDLGCGNRGEITPSSYRLGQDYFENAMHWVLAEISKASNEQARAKAEQAAADRLARFRQISTGRRAGLTQKVEESV